MTEREDETVDFWRAFPQEDLALRVAILHRQRRELSESILPERVFGARQAIAALFAHGRGIEVGAGSRPYPVPAKSSVSYGDVRDADQLKSYFGEEIDKQGFIDAQTFHGIEANSLDFVISAHVIEHLENPIGNISGALSVIKTGGHYIMSVPDLRYTFDVNRPATGMAHLLADARDGGRGTRLESFKEHFRYVHTYFGGTPFSEDALEEIAIKASAEGKMDLHFHAWTYDTFLEMLDLIKDEYKFEITVSIEGIVNENIFVIRRLI